MAKTSEKEPCPKCNKRFKSVSTHQRLSACGSSDNGHIAIAKKELPPGTIIGVGTGNPHKLPFRAKHLRDMRKVMIVNPPETVEGNYNGLHWRIEAGVDIEVAEVIAGDYNNYLRNKNLPVPKVTGEVDERVFRVAHQGYGLIGTIPEEV